MRPSAPRSGPAAEKAAPVPPTARPENWLRSPRKPLRIRVPRDRWQSRGRSCPDARLHSSLAAELASFAPATTPATRTQNTILQHFVSRDSVGFVRPENRLTRLEHWLPSPQNGLRHPRAPPIRTSFYPPQQIGFVRAGPIARPTNVKPYSILLYAHANKLASFGAVFGRIRHQPISAPPFPLKSNDSGSCSHDWL